MRSKTPIAIALLIFVWIPEMSSARLVNEGEKIFSQAEVRREVPGSKEDLRVAVDLYEKALRIFLRTDYDKRVGDVFNSLAIIFWNWGETRKSLNYYEKCLRTRKDAGDVRGTCRALTSLGDAYQKLGKYDQAVAYYLQSSNVAKRSRDGFERELALNLISVGDTHMIRALYEQALEHYTKGVLLWREIVARQGRLLGFPDLRSTEPHAPKSDEETHQQIVWAEDLAARRISEIAMDPRKRDSLRSFGQDLEAFERACDKYWSLFGYREEEILNRESARTRELLSKKTDWLKERKPLSLSVSKGGAIYYCSASDIYKALGFKRGLAEISKLAATRVWWEFTEEKYRRALEAYRALNDPSGIADVIVLREEERGALINRVFPEHALPSYREALSTYERLGYAWKQVHVLTNLGNVHLAMQDYARSEEYYQKALEIARKVGCLKEQAELLWHLGTQYVDRGYYLKAKSCLDKALAMSQAQGDTGRQAFTLRSIGKLNRHLGDHAGALECLQDASSMAEKLKRSLRSAIFRDLVETYVQIGDFDRAMEMLDKKGVADADRFYDWDAGRLKARILLDAGQIRRAASVLVQAFYDREPDFLNLARLLLSTGADEAAQGIYLKLLDGVGVGEGLRHKEMDTLFSICSGLGLSYERTGEYPKASEYYRKAIEMTEISRSRLPAGLRNCFFDVKVQGFTRTEPYEGLARVYLKTNRQLKAFEMSEFTKARMFAESILRRSSGSAFTIPADIRQDMKLREEIAALRNRRQWARDQETLQSLEHLIGITEEKTRIHRKLLRKKYPVFEAMSYPEPMALTEMELREGEWVLAYDVTNSGVIVYLIRGKRIVRTVFSKIKRDELNHLVRRFREPLEMKSDAESEILKQLRRFDFVSGRKLADLLLGDLLPHLPVGAPVLIAPDECLGGLPYEALVLSEGGKVLEGTHYPRVSGCEFLGDRNPICYCQSVTAVALRRKYRKPPPRGKRLLVFADPVFQMSDPRAQITTGDLGVSSAKSVFFRHVKARIMPAVESAGYNILLERASHTGELAEALRRIFPGRTDIFRGIEASKNNMLRKVGPRITHYDKIVFATHGTGSPLPGIQEPTLFLSLVPPGTDGYLRMTEIMNFKLNADLVVLAACQTALGKRISGEGTLGLGRAFQYAGARFVLASLWSVWADSSVKLVTSFFQRLKGGKDKLKALHMAKKQLRNNGYDHPFFWAAFILMGEAVEHSVVGNGARSRQLTDGDSAKSKGSGME